VAQSNCERTMNQAFRSSESACDGRPSRPPVAIRAPECSERRSNWAHAKQRWTPQEAVSIVRGRARGSSCSHQNELTSAEAQEASGFFQRNFLFIFPVAMFVVLATFAVGLAM
jgi:hypothetical protein